MDVADFERLGVYDLTTMAVAETTGDSLAFEPLAGLSLEGGDAVYRVMRA